MNYTAPKPLKKGDKVAIISPSSPISSSEQIYDSLPIFEKNNLKPVFGSNVIGLNSDNWSSGSIQDRVEEIAWAFADDSINGIIAAEGGWSAIELVPYLPYDIIRENPKVFMGMSDVTAINTGILSGANLINFSGPNVRIRKDYKYDVNNLNKALELLKKDEKWNIAPWYANNKLQRRVCDGLVDGKSIGGNLTLFSALAGTPFMPDCEGAILFLEDIWAGGFEVSLSLNRLELTGILDQINGVVFGEFMKQPQRGVGDMTIEDIIVSKFRDRCPCLYGFNFSHGELVANIPLGVDTVLDADNMIVSFDNPFK